MSAERPPRALLLEGLKELDINCTPAQVQAFMTYLSELKKWNKFFNLTSLKSDEDIIIKHFLDSLLYLKAMPEGELSVLDVGSGAGFPGIPLKLVRPELMMYLLEPTGKKANFLSHMVKLLGLNNTEVIGKRVEALEAMEVDLAVTRALFDIKDFCKKLAPVLKRGGTLVLSKGPKVDEELKAIEGKDLDCRVLTVGLPLTDIKRFIVVIRQNAADKTIAPGQPPASERPNTPRIINVCFNIDCRLRKAGCRGFEGCPGFKGKR